VLELGGDITDQVLVPMLREISYAKEHKLIAGGIQQTDMAT
jgi:hypothetical protein